MNKKVAIRDIVTGKLSDQDLCYKHCLSRSWLHRIKEKLYQAGVNLKNYKPRQSVWDDAIDEYLKTNRTG